VLTEEELKRLNEALASDSSYSAVGFNYDGDTNADSVQQTGDNGTNHSFNNIIIALLAQYCQLDIHYWILSI